MDGEFYLLDVTPKHPIPPTIPPEVQRLSPTFLEVYTQSAAAEGHNLSQIAGVGYRKALEFLVKDYCIAESAADEDAIRREFLGVTINNRLADTRIREVARRAAWLGNDETHYTRKWEDRDITDLKTLIDLTMAFIHSELVARTYIEEMDKAK